jgi:hypothetical protein
MHVDMPASKESWHGWAQVAYLAIATFLDKRTEDEERKKYEAAQKTRCVQGANRGKPLVLSPCC